MNDLQKVLVVDDGERPVDHSLSTELAELGFSSVTTSLEATDDVLAVIAAPSAIFLQMPDRREAMRYDAFVSLADRLRGREIGSVPVFMVEHGFGQGAGSVSAMLGQQFGSQVLAAAAL